MNCGASVSGQRLEVRNLRVLGLLSPGWASYGGGFDWCATSNPDTVTGYASCGTYSGGWLMPAGQKAIHWASSRRPNISGVQCVATIYEARAATGQLLANSGFDHIRNGGILGDLFISRYVIVGTEWRTVAGSNCSPSTLRAMPPL